ncbi:unnamed protein product [Dovyalis caffra]|uniref:Uncharacterized protein n=1 Tax=Dovyalis caffra TaxID=77055 RepID=A0AAV1SSP1_9ROSI|nr:unnamed protein product [Dovyalis caffra]
MQGNEYPHFTWWSSVKEDAEFGKARILWALKEPANLSTQKQQNTYSMPYKRIYKFKTRKDKDEELPNKAIINVKVFLNLSID